MQSWWRWPALCILLGCFVPAQAGAGVTFKAVMIHASDTPAPIDRRLEHIEYKLRRMLKFEHYKHAGEGSVSVSLPGSGTIQLGGGYSLHIQAADAGKGKVSTQVQWKKGGSSLLKTQTRVSRGSPTVLGGISQGSGKLMVILTAR
jgi:hypothetical protein